MTRFSILIALLSLPISAQADPLTGRVESRNPRISRPAVKSNQQTRLPAKLDMSTQNFQLPAAAQQNQLMPTLAEPINDQAAGAPVIKAGTDETIIKAPGSTPQPSNDHRRTNDTPQVETKYRPDGTTYTPGIKGKTVIVRLSQCTGRFEIAEEVFHIADRMLRKNGDVIIFLDVEAVHIADQQFAFYDGHINDDESGNDRSISIKDLRSALSSFIADGGTVIVSEHWAKALGLTKRNSLLPGVQLKSADELAQLLLDAQSVINY